jgi:hypothetical protein
VELAGLEPATSWVRCRPRSGRIAGMFPYRLQARFGWMPPDIAGLPLDSGTRGDECLNARRATVPVAARRLPLHGPPPLSRRGATGHGISAACRLRLGERCGRRLRSVEDYSQSGGVDAAIRMRRDLADAARPELEVFPPTEACMRSKRSRSSSSRRWSWRASSRVARSSCPHRRSNKLAFRRV